MERKATLSLAAVLVPLACPSGLAATVTPNLGGTRFKYGFAILEFLFLGGIFMLWRLDHRRRYHDRWIEYRSLAEFLRPMIHLSLVGHTYPLNKPRAQEEEIARDRLCHAGPARSWVFMYVETVIRWAGVVGVRMDESYLRRCREHACVSWIDRTSTRASRSIGG